MALSWEIGQVLGEEQRDYVHTCLFQLDYFRKLVKRTGLVEKAEEVGWWMGDEVWSGLSPLDAVADHLNRVIAILDLPLHDAWVDDAYSVVVGEMRSPFGGLVGGIVPEKLVSLDGQDVFSTEEGEEPIDEEDLLVTLRGEQHDLDELARVWPKLQPKGWLAGKMILCRRERREEEEPEDETLAQRFERERRDREEPEAPHICVLCVSTLFETETIYETLFEVLIRTWEVKRDAENAKRKARSRNGLRRRRARQRRERRRRRNRRAHRAVPGAG